MNPLERDEDEIGTPGSELNVEPSFSQTRIKHFING